MKQNEEKHLVPRNSDEETSKTLKENSEKELEKPILSDKEDLVVKELLQEGGCGCVYNATYKNKHVVVKTSVAESKDKYILQEYEFLKIIQKENVRGIPKIGPRFVHEERQSFVLEKLGKDLFEKREETRKDKFSLKTTVKVALQVLKILNHVHSCGIVHKRHQT